MPGTHAEFQARPWVGWPWPSLFLKLVEQNSCCADQASSTSLPNSAGLFNEFVQEAEQSFRAGGAPDGPERNSELPEAPQT